MSKLYCQHREKTSRDHSKLGHFEGRLLQIVIERDYSKDEEWIGHGGGYLKD
jgi:hypothetical protein